MHVGDWPRTGRYPRGMINVSSCVRQPATGSFLVHVNYCHMYRNVSCRNSGQIMARFKLFHVSVMTKEGTRLL